MSFTVTVTLKDSEGNTVTLEASAETVEEQEEPQLTIACPDGDEV